MDSLKSKKVLGLDIGSNSIGFSFLELMEENNQCIFNELASNSIIFNNPNDAKDRRDARSSRRRNERKSARNRNTRKVFIDFKIADKSFLTNTTEYLNSFNLKNNDVYSLRQKAVNGTNLTKQEFILATYSILTNRGYNNMFSISKDDGIINEAVSSNNQIFKSKGYTLPSMILTSKKKELENTYQNIPIRNKADDYQNSLDRNMHKIEFENLVLSQLENKNIFSSAKKCKEFIKIILEDKYNTFYQRPLKSFENMVDYCAFYDKYNPKGSQKKAPLSNIRNIELSLRQKIDNHDCIDSKTGEIHTLSQDEKNTIIDFWINTPSAITIINTNIFKALETKKLYLDIHKDSNHILDIKAHKNILTILDDYNIDFNNTQNNFYNEILLELYYFKNKSSREEKIKKIIENYNLNLDDTFIERLANLDDMNKFASFSLKFINEVLEIIKNQNKTHFEALEILGYNSKYINMPTYDYLPPLNPTDEDIKWLKNNINYFEKKHIFYQPMVSPIVKRVISILRKLINELIKKYGKIDEIRIETAKEMNSEKAKYNISTNQNKDKLKNDKAKKLLKSSNKEQSQKNIQRAKLFIEQSKNGSQCLYSGEIITLEEALDETQTEVDHFIPRSTIWINSFKNKILVKKRYNQDKGSKDPIEYLKSKGEWENFKNRVSSKSIATNKQNWLTNEDIINSNMKNEYWQDRYLNDTRTATKTIQKYLNHYLYPNKKAHNKDGKRKIFSVSGRAINELKYMWGIHNIMPKDKDNKKDRDTNYHHTIDAFAIALCSASAINTLHSFFKNKENFRNKKSKENLSLLIPKSQNNQNIAPYLKQLVEKYNTNKQYVCPFNKRKINQKGFKDSNVKLYIAKDKKNNNILSEIKKYRIDSSILIKNVNGFPKDRTDKEVLKEIETIINKLDKQKQKNIIDAIQIYTDELLKLNADKKLITKEINKLQKTLKTTQQLQQHKEFNNEIKEKIKPYNENQNIISKKIKDLKCSFVIKNGKRQIVKSVKLKDINATSADIIIFEDNMKRLTIDSFKEAYKNKKPFSIKLNNSILNVELINSKDKGQRVGLNYFSSIAKANNIKTKINDNNLDKDLDFDNSLTLYKYDIIEVKNLAKSEIEYYIFNGGGEISGTNNKIIVKNINFNSFQKLNKKQEITKSEIRAITPNKDIIISRVNIDFFGNITKV